MHIRWYWSRMRDLYDLAFLAKDEPLKKAEIADSLKSRPALQWNDWEALARDDKENAEFYRAIFEAEAQALGGGFIKAHQELRKECSKRYHKDREQQPLGKVPEGWIVIHFYLNHLEEKGYALIYDGDLKKWREEPETFEYDGIFNAFKEWQTNYNRLPHNRKYLSSKQLEALCKKIGEEMEFLFKLPSDPTNPKKVLFIPHDFLHRLPLHGAISKEEKVFLENHPSCYLPAWSLAQVEDDNNINNINSIYLLKNDYRDEFVKLKGYLSKQPLFLIKDPASPEDFKSISSPPNLLIVICHGKADMVNPFNAKIILTGSGITHLEILQPSIRLNKTKVFLGACETDLVPLPSDILDEHLSISTAFLEKGASEILGALWEADIGDIAGDEENEGIAYRCCNTSDTLRDIIRKWQIENIGKYKEEKNSYYLFRPLTFRVLGMG